MSAHVSPSPVSQGGAILPNAGPNGNRIDSQRSLCYPNAIHGFSCRVTIVRPQDSRIFVSTFFIVFNAGSFSPWLFRGICALVCLAILLVSSPDASAKRKRHRKPRPEPELKILELKVSPNPYTVSAGSVEFSALVQLPKELNDATLLEVSSLVSSPSKTSIRFLSMRKPLEPHSTPKKGAEPPRVSIVLTWDGMDHTKAPAEAGTYQYELRAKLLVNGEKGPRTRTVSWPKRGTLEVR